MSLPDQSNKLFVGQVPGTATDAQVREVFGPYGTIQEVMFLKNKVTGAHRGCAFVTFSTKEEAETALEALHEKHTLPGAKRTLIIRIAGQNKKPMGGGDETASEHKLYVAMLSRNTTQEEFQALFEPYGNVLDTFLMHEKGDTTKSRGCGFVKFATRDECLRAITAMHGIVKDKDSPQFMQVRFAHTKTEKDQQQNMMNFMPGMMQGNMGMGAMGWQGFPNPADPYGTQQFGSMGGMGGMGGGMGGMQQPGYPPMGQMNGMNAMTPPGTDGFGMGGMGGQGGMGQGGMGQGMGQYGGYGAMGGMGGMGGAAGGGGGGHMQTKGPNGANLFIYGIPDSYRDENLATLFASFGAILSAKVQVDTTTGRSKGFGFVSFDNASVAQAAISAMDGFVLQGKKLNVRVKRAAGETQTHTSQNRFAPY